MQLNNDFDFRAIQNSSRINKNGQTAFQIQNGIDQNNRLSMNQDDDMDALRSKSLIGTNFALESMLPDDNESDQINFKQAKKPNNMLNSIS
jgi:hypothetical protein